MPAGQHQACVQIKQRHILSWFGMKNLMLSYHQQLKPKTQDGLHRSQLYGASCTEHSSPDDSLPLWFIRSHGKQEPCPALLLIVSAGRWACFLHSHADRLMLFLTSLTQDEIH